MNHASLHSSCPFSPVAPKQRPPAPTAAADNDGLTKKKKKADHSAHAQHVTHPMPSTSATTDRKTMLTPSLSTLTFSPPSSATTMTTRRYALLLTSLGNPAPLHQTRHSAGHILLRSLALDLAAPPFQRSKRHGGGQLTHSGNLSLWQSPSLMNVSGPAVLSAWRAFVQDHHAAGSPSTDTVGLGLVVLHDELEATPATLKVKRGMGGSVKGHNGLKSVINSFRAAGLAKGDMEAKFVRMGIGIGRPLGRSSKEVSDYVLGKVLVAEKEGIEGLVGELVELLDEEGKRIAKTVR
ncbi:hypothetical protein GJ744_000214 [Endocarpon pusillum]|uniref:peptidyl-tRNA hydrolase n=1 Tax=Endocarpon pusillum TaxID=364733 RepID=A0A8H7AVS3_9EURO|nr:hypothetical protein GJ744_000214 [Endocarpon pusillum]